jgi:hypothetical protein
MLAAIAKHYGRDKSSNLISSFSLLSRESRTTLALYVHGVLLSLNDSISRFMIISEIPKTEMQIIFVAVL